MENAKWVFPDNGGGEVQGLNNALIETFNDNPLKSLAREICQNSLDAALPGKQVIVEFSTFNTNNSDFPVREEFENVLHRCEDFTKNSKNTKTRDFFAEATNTINQDEITFLRVSDFNTTGLKGSDKDRDTDWANLVHSAGSSDKNGDKGGSFGIGKGAPYACSSLRTVFYSTLDVDGRVASQGVSKLTSFVIDKNPDGSDKIAQGVGYWGLYNGYKIYPKQEMLSLDPKFNRTESGTDIYIAGLKKDIYENTSELQATIINEVLDGFLLAIWDEKLEVRVNSRKINKSTLSEIMSDQQIKFNNSIKMSYKLLSSDKTEWSSIPIEISNMPVGKINLAFSLCIDGNNKISMIRSSGMKILDKDKLCPTLRYTGIAIVEGDKLNEWLRNLENPSHNKWEPKRYNPLVSQKLLTNIYNSIKDKLDEYAEKNIDSTSDIAEAGKFIPVDNGVDDKIESKKKRETASRPVGITKASGKKTKAMSGLAGKIAGGDVLGGTVGTEPGFAVDGPGIDGPIGSNGGGGAGLGQPPKGKAINKPMTTVKAKHIRIFCINKEQQTYRLIFTPTESARRGFIRIYKIAENTERENARITAVNCEQQVTFKDNYIGEFVFAEDEAIKLDLEIKGKEYSSMEVQLYAYKS